MTRFLVRRAGGAVVVLGVAVTVMFLLMHTSSVSPIDSLSPSVAADPAARRAIEDRLGLDRPLLEQYVDEVGGMLVGDFGTSYYDGRSVSDQIRRALPVSLELGALAAVFALGTGTAAGAWSARHRGTRRDGTARVLTVLALSIPSYWLAVLCLVVVGDRVPDLLPAAGGYIRLTDDPIGNLQTMLLPAIVLGLAAFAMVARSLRSALVGALEADDAQFARAMGMSERDVVRRIALRNSVVPTLTVMGLVIGGMMAGTVLIENVFQLPGLGQLMVTAFVRRDFPLALGALVVTAVLFLTLNVVIDALAHVVDPRLTRGLTREQELVA